MAQPGYLDRNLTWTRRNAWIAIYRKIKFIVIGLSARIRWFDEKKEKMDGIGLEYREIL